MSDCGMCTERSCPQCYPVQKMDKPEYPLGGTWDVVYRHGEPRYVVEHDGGGGWWSICEPEKSEDCYVLAASKDLLAALKEANEDTKLYEGHPGKWAKQIAKAEGK